MKDPNKTTVTKQDLLAVMEAADEIGAERSERDWYVGFAAVAEVHRGNFDKIVAVMFRMEAMVKLLTEEGAPGWTLPSPTPDGPILAQDAIVAAAAEEPLVDRDNHLVFDRESFLRRALSLVVAEGTA